MWIAAQTKTQATTPPPKLIEADRREQEKRLQEIRAKVCELVKVKGD